MRDLDSGRSGAGLSSWEDHGLLSLGSHTPFAEGDVLPGQQAAGAYAALIRWGVVKVTTVTGANDTLLAIRGPGDLIGEEDALLGSPGPGHSAASLWQATALTAGSALVFPAERLRQFISDRPDALLRLAQGLCEQLGRAEACIAGAASENADRRLARFLHDACKLIRFGVPGHTPDPWVPLRLTQAELASRIGVSRVTVDRVLHRWRARGIVSTGHRRIVVHDMEALARLAGCSPADGQLALLPRARG
jgi:CRP/FNR family transcriptional regulator, cyclic AMP receptor protein